MSVRQAIRSAPWWARARAALGVPARFFYGLEFPTQSFRSMGAVATLTLGAGEAGQLEAVTATIRGIFDRLEAELSVYRPDSSISALAQRAGVSSVAVSEDAYRLLVLSQHVGSLSRGTFDPTAAPLAGLWGFNGAPVPTALPEEQTIHEFLKLVDCRRLVLRDRTAFLPLRGMAVDLGGIAKGYAVDCAYEWGVSAGVRDFLVDFSGSIRASGQPVQGQNWQIGVRDPFDRSRVLGKISLPGGMALSTSGSYERFVEVAGERFSHIIDPRTGYPVEGAGSVTVLCGGAATADALSTAFFVVGRKGAPELWHRLPSLELLIVPDRYPAQLCLTPGFAKIFSPAPGLDEAVTLLDFTK